MKKNQLTKLRWLLLCLMISVGVGNAWADTSTLTNANIVSAGNGTSGYQSWTITDDNSNTWNAYAIKNQHSNATSAYHYLQIKKYTSNTAYYIQVPTFGTKITSITMTVSSASQPMTGGGNSATLFFSSSNSTSAAGTGVASGTGTSSVTIDCSSLNLNTGYITASAGVRIWNITVTYTAGGSSKTETTTTFPNASYSATYPGTFSAPTATVKAGSTTVISPAVSYSSNNTSVATVNSSTGAVTLAGVGTAIITATYAGNSTYEASSGSYTLTVSSGASGAYTWDLSTSSYDSNSADEVRWTSTEANMTLAKGSSSTAANNYLGGDANNRTSTRFYKDQTLTITPATGYSITSIVFTAATNAYATTFAGSTWTNASASASGTTVTITPTDGTKPVIAVPTAVCGFVGVTVTTEASTPVASVTFGTSTKTLKVGQSFTNTVTTVPTSLAISGYTSSATSVATVNAAGKVTAVSPGTATITATWAAQTIEGVSYESGSATYTVTVEKANAVLRFPFDNFYTLTGQTFMAPTLYTYPDGISVTYSSSATSVATVNSSGNITINAAGTTTITATFAGNSNYNGTSATYELKVGTGVGSSSATTASWTASEQQYSNGAAVSSATVDANVSLTFAKGSNSNAPKYYDSGTAIRLYGGNTMTVSSTQTITSIVITFGTGGDSNAITTDVGTYNSGTWEGSANSVTFTVSGTSGNRRISAIMVSYSSGSSSNVEFVDVSSISQLLALDDDTPARLYLAAKSGTDANARVLQASGTEVYVRDATAALLIKADAANRFTPVPKYNQHVSGWVRGTKKTSSDLPYLDISTATSHLAFAAPVTEPQTLPRTISTVSELSSYKSDWVVVESQRIGSTLVVDNHFSLTTSNHYSGNPYTDALVDLSGIVRDDNTIAPVYNNDIYPLVYVLDETQEFTSPSSDISHASVRLVRTLRNDIWNTFAVPFAFDMEGTVRQYDHLDGTTMVFSTASGVQPSVPYLVKPEETIVNPVFNDVTLSSTAAQEVSNGSAYSYVATYSPVVLSTDKTEYFLTATGDLKYPASSAQATMKGMRAYFRVPSGVTNAKVKFSDDPVTAISEVQQQKQPTTLRIFSVSGQYVGSDLRQLPQGLYIVNGKKVYIK